MIVNVTGTGSGSVSIDLESTDDFGATWLPIAPSPAVTRITTSTVGSSQIIVSDCAATLVRARVSTASTGMTLGFVLIKGWYN
jgi:hypothetical protein